MSFVEDISSGRLPGGIAGQLRSARVPLLALSLVLGGCDERPLPVQPAEDPAASASVAPATLRTPKGDLVTGDAEVFAEALKEIGRDGEVLVWIKDAGAPRPDAQFLLDLPASGKETIALPTEAPGAQRRRNIGPPSARATAIEAVVRALTEAGAPAPRRMQALPVIEVELPEHVRVAALRALMRHPNVDYVSAVRARPVTLHGTPTGTNPIDAKHTVHKIPQAWDLTRGSGAKVGILDSGFARNSVTGGFHNDGLNFGSYGIVPLGFVDDICGSGANNGYCTPYDDWYASNGSAHGTSMTGLVGANDNNMGVVGIAPMAITYSMKIAWNTYIQGHCGNGLGDLGDDSSYCIEDDDFVRAIDYGAAQGLRVLSMSFGGDQSSDVYRALYYARTYYDVFLVAATGNTAGGTAEEPAAFDVVMGVAGVDAAGNNLFSTAARDVSGYAGGATLSATCSNSYYCDAGSPGHYTEGAGTSAATANVAGIVALVRSYHRLETASQIWDRLLLTAEGPNMIVNAYAAIAYQHPLSVTIEGPSYADAYTYQTWTAVAMYGTPPYSYAWYGEEEEVVGTGETYSRSVPYYGMYLMVQVTDATGATRGAYKWVGSDGRCGYQRMSECGM